jgi:hypothetical protein
MGQGLEIHCLFFNNQKEEILIEIKDRIVPGKASYSVKRIDYS